MSDQMPIAVCPTGGEDVDNDCDSVRSVLASDPHLQHNGLVLPARRVGFIGDQILDIRVRLLLLSLLVDESLVHQSVCLRLYE